MRCGLTPIDDELVEIVEGLAGDWAGDAGELANGDAAAARSLNRQIHESRPKRPSQLPRNRGLTDRDSWFTIYRF